MLAGLMAATLLSGVAPAYAQSNQDQRGNRGGERAGSVEGGAAVSRGNRMNQPRGADQAQRSQQRTAERPVQQIAPPRQEVRPERRVEQRPEQRANPQWRGDQNRPGIPAQREARQDRRDDRQQNGQDRRNDQRENQQNWRNDRRDARQDGRNDRRDDRQDWRNDRRDDRRDDRGDDRRDDRRWTDNRGQNGANWNNGRRYDDRTRWSNQRRWDNGWRQDRRYDWNSYRNRYGDRYRMGRYYAPRGWDYGYRRFSVGIVLSSLLYSNSYWLDDPYSYRLPPAYGTLRWVRYYDDAMLVDIRDGYVVDVIHNFFW
ncbi:ATP-dependent RNA helicase [Sphingobium sp. AR-3-1]|uniref:ATP-dependent RNA helicase n=1 Tax=Sphingobium psychrophilum TaxID=2728834 RepID=A0A7X9WXY9_9SPHN|nr:RcnB family protein [Sphingobium psychrophilum]NML11915.1 ATP-dependent RNA helicase [Sphingobium psychrophilum]